MGPEELLAIFRQTKIEEAQKTFEAFYHNSTDAYRSLVAQGLATRLGLWGEPRIRELTRTTEIDYASMQQQLFTWYLATPADKVELKPLAALIFNTALEVVGTSNFMYPVTLLLDEFTNFGYIRGFPQKLTILRHDNIPVVLGIQDYVQLELMYGKEAPLFLSQPGTRIFFKPNDLTTAQNISRGLGIAEEFDIKVTSSGQLHETTDRKPLLSAEELLALDSKEIVVFLPKTHPAKVKAFSWADYRKLTDNERYPVPTRRRLEINESLLSCKTYMSHDGGGYEREFQTELAKFGETHITDELSGGWAQC